MQYLMKNNVKEIENLLKGSSKNSFYSLSCLHEDSEYKFVRFVQFVFKSNN